MQYTRVRVHTYNDTALPYIIVGSDTLQQLQSLLILIRRGIRSRVGSHQILHHRLEGQTQPASCTGRRGGHGYTVPRGRRRRRGHVYLTGLLRVRAEVGATGRGRNNHGILVKSKQLTYLSMPYTYGISI